MIVLHYSDDASRTEFWDMWDRAGGGLVWGLTFNGVQS